jgi:hypothetical protein
MALFTYHCWESPYSEHAELWRHTNQHVEILYEHDLDHKEFRMFRIRFADGYEHDAFEDELSG